MNEIAYRVESHHQILGPLLPQEGTRCLRVRSRDLAVSMAAKCITQPYGQEIRVVHEPTGEIVFRKAAAQQQTWADD